MSCINGELRVVPVLCDRWCCALCGVRKAAWLKRNIQAARVAHRLEGFVTLTLQADRDPVASFQAITGYWNVLNTGLAAAYGRRVSYVWTVEATQRGIAHLHVLMDVVLSPADLSRRWRSITGDSYIVRVLPTDSRRASDYLAKYCVKEASQRRDPEWSGLAGRRLYSKSRNIRFPCFRCGELHASRDACGDPVYEWERVPVPFKVAVAGIVSPVLRRRMAGVPSVVFDDRGGELRRELRKRVGVRAY